MFDLQSAVQSAVQSADCSAASDQTCTFPVYHTNGRSIKNTAGEVLNRLVGIGLKASGWGINAQPLENLSYWGGQ